MIKTAITPRVSETDGVGHVNNTIVPVWFEAGRRTIFKIFTPDLSFKKWRMALVHMSVDFEFQIRFDEDAEVRTWIEHVGTKSFAVAEQIWQKEKKCATGKAIYVNFNYLTQQSEPICNEIRQKLDDLQNGLN